MGVIYRHQSSPRYRTILRGGSFRWWPEEFIDVSIPDPIVSIGEFRINGWQECCDRLDRCNCNLAFITDFRISSEMRGKGYGSQMMEDLILLCQDVLQFKSIRLTVDAKNKTAIGLYKKFGFETRLARFGGTAWMMEKV